MKANEEILDKSINRIAKWCHANAVEKGFWDDYYEILDEFNEGENVGCQDLIDYANKRKLYWLTSMLALIGTEVYEAIEDLRETGEVNPEELADIVIRTFDLAAGLEIDLENEVFRKMEINKTRDYLHGKKF